MKIGKSRKPKPEAPEITDRKRSVPLEATSLRASKGLSSRHQSAKRTDKMVELSES